MLLVLQGDTMEGRREGGHTKTQRLGGKGWEWRLTPELTSTDDSKETLVRGGGTTPPHVGGTTAEEVQGSCGESLAQSLGLQSSQGS